MQVEHVELIHDMSKNVVPCCAFFLIVVVYTPFCVLCFQALDALVCWLEKTNCRRVKNNKTADN